MSIGPINCIFCGEKTNLDTPHGIISSCQNELCTAREFRAVYYRKKIVIYIESKKYKTELTDDNIIIRNYEYLTINAKFELRPMSIIDFNNKIDLYMLMK